MSPFKSISIIRASLRKKDNILYAKTTHLDIMIPKMQRNLFTVSIAFDKVSRYNSNINDTNEQIIIYPLI